MNIITFKQKLDALKKTLLEADHRLILYKIGSKKERIGEADVTDKAFKGKTRLT